MKQRLLCPSMMCADLKHLEKEVRTLEEAGCDCFHIDIMDGVFVPNFGMGLQDLECIRTLTDRLVDVHLMIQDPSRYVETFCDMGADIVYFHPEADLHPARTLELIRQKGKKAGLAINPGTSLSSVEALFPLIDYLLVMTVNPGFAGQTYLSFVDEKIKQVLSCPISFQVIIDGAVSLGKMKTLGKLGVHGFVLGTSALFQKERTYADLIAEFRSFESSK